MSEQKDLERARVVDAMCMTWRHDFGLERKEDELGSCGMTDGERDALRRQMGQLYDHHLAAPSLPAAGSAELIAEAERCLFVLREIGSMDADDITGDDVDLRFEDEEGCDTGCDVSIVDYAEKSADVIEKMIAALSAQQSAQDDEYPPCDYCGVVPDYHPWHGSGAFRGVENPHIHACNDCRHLLPTAQSAPERVSVPRELLESAACLLELGDMDGPTYRELRALLASHTEGRKV